MEFDIISRDIFFWFNGVFVGEMKKIRKGNHIKDMKESTMSLFQRGDLRVLISFDLMKLRPI